MSALDTKAIEDERKALEILVESIEGASEDDMKVLLKEIEKTAQKIEEMCEALQAKADAIPRPESEMTPEAFVEIVLTPEQRARVLEKTGIDVPSLRLEDPTSELTRNMIHVEPDYIEARAIEQAEMFISLTSDMEE